MQPFHELELRYKRRSHSELVFLEESRVVTSFDAIASRVEAYAWASYLTELTETVLPAAEHCRPVYELYRTTLAGLADAAPPIAHGQHYVLRLLEYAGWRPDFERCSVCAAAHDAETQPIVDPRGGGIICARHDAERSGSEAAAPAYRLRRRVIDPELLAYVRASCDEPQPNGAAATLAAATMLIDRLIELHVPRSLKTRRVLAELMNQS